MEGHNYDSDTDYYSDDDSAATILDLTDICDE